METDDEMRAACDLATLFIRIGKAIAQHGLAFLDNFYETLSQAVGGDANVDALLCAMQAYHIPNTAPGGFGDSLDSCVHCKAVAETPGVVPVEAHAPDCPVIIDVWPVTWVEVLGEQVCESCHEPFRLGEFYVSFPEVRCLGCAALKGRTA